MPGNCLIGNGNTVHAVHAVHACACGIHVLILKNCLYQEHSTNQLGLTGMYNTVYLHSYNNSRFYRFTMADPYDSR